MAITDTHPTTEPGSDAAAPAATSAFPQPRGVAAVIGTGDHKTLGRLYIGFSLFFGVGALVLTALFNVNGVKDISLLSDHAFQFFTLGQLGLGFLFLLPLFIGLATAVVPLQVGARTIAFPRAAAAAFWAWLVSSVLLVVSYLPAVGGGIWVDSRDGSLLTLLALIGLTFSLLLATVCVVTTVIALRTPGMHLDQVPLFSWSMLVAGGVWLFTLPVFAANVALIFVDTKYGAPALFGTASKEWSQLSWLFTQPAAFILAIPALGIVGDAIAMFARGRQPLRGALLFSIGLFGALSLGAYAQPVFFPGVYLQWVFVSQSAALFVPVLILLGTLAYGIKRGSPKAGSPVVLAFVSLLLLLVGAFAAVPFGLGRLGAQYSPKAVVNTDLALRQASTGSPLYTWGVLAIVGAGAFAGALAGIYLWGPKIAGKKHADGVGTLLALIVLVGGLVSGLPLLVLGFANRTEGLADSADVMFWAAAAGTAIVAFVVLVALVVSLASRVSALSGSTAGEPDPWGFGQTLEWAAASPPEPGNFGELAHVTSPEPLLDLAETGGTD
jgi:heme/copper-type cytochrome/quinol oxidase subunit 1